MQLRNGKNVSDQQTQYKNSKNIEPKPLSINDKFINALICNLINKHKDFKPLHSLSLSSRTNLFIEEIRLLRETYYLIEYYSLHITKNPKFETFQHVLKKKTPEFIDAICYQLRKGMFRMLDDNDLKNVNELLYEMQKILFCLLV